MWGREAEEVKAAMTTTGPTEGGPGQRAAAERLRCRRRRASPGTVRVEARPGRRGDRPISPGSVAEGSDGRGGGGASSAERGRTGTRYRRRAQAPSRLAGTVSGAVGREAALTRRAAATAVGACRESSAVPRAGAAPWCQLVSG